MCAFIDGKTIYRHVSKYVYEVGRYKSAIGMPNLQNIFLMIFYAWFFAKAFDLLATHLT